MNNLPPINIPEGFNYIAIFLNFSCQLRCSYCINHHGGDLEKRRWMNGEDWIRGLSRIHTRDDLPITIQGGEPTIHRYFYEIVNGVPGRIPIDLLTNLEIDEKDFKRGIRAGRMSRSAPYASIRVSYHHGQSKLFQLLRKVKILQEEEYSIGIWEVNHPEYQGECLKRQKMAKECFGIDWRIKEFLGPWKGENYGSIRYADSVNASHLRHCDCRTSELLVDPSGNIFRCHSDLYANRCTIGNLLDPAFGEKDLGLWRPCEVYGRCNSCDVKIKTNRFQVHGHSSVEIRGLSDPLGGNSVVENVENTYGRV